MPTLPITPTPVFDGNPQQLTLPGFFLPPNWAKSMTVSTTWSTTVVPNQKDGEARRGNISKPTRTIKGDVLASSIEQVGRLQGYLQRTGFTRFLAPLFPDQVFCKEADFAADNDFLWVSEDYPLDVRRFYVGNYVVIFNPRTEFFAVRKITEVNLISNSLTFDDEVGFITHPDTLIVPMISSKLILKNESEVLTDRVVTAEIEGQELPGKDTIRASIEAKTTPAGYSEYANLPVLSNEIDRRRGFTSSFERTGQFSAVGNTQVESVYGDRMRQSRKFSLLFSERDKFWRFLQFFDSRAGRLFPWWLPTFAHEYDITAFTVNGVKVRSFGPIEDWEARPYISIRNEDGTVEVRTIESISTNNIEDTLVLDEPFVNTSVGSVVMAGAAHLVRFSSDTMEENWITDGVVVVEVEAIEVLQETTITLANFSEIQTSALASKYTPEECVSDGSGCDEACIPCANCTISTNSFVTLSILDINADINKNGMSPELADNLVQDGPFEIPFAEFTNQYFIYRRTIDFDPTPLGVREIQIEIRLDCLTGVWSWSYNTRLGTAFRGPFRACGDCLLSGSPAVVPCEGRGSNADFFEDCWNTHVHYSIEAYTDFNAADDRNICTGIVGWAAAEVTSPIPGVSGFADSGTSIMWGVRGEWSLTNGFCCPEPPGSGPCIPCLNSCLVEIDCSKSPIPSSTGCLARKLGLPAFDSGGVVTCSNCDILITYTGGVGSCCDGTLPQDCPLIEVRAATPGCLGCFEPDFDPCPRVIA
jgi:hypothetical protein